MHSNSQLKRALLSWDGILRQSVLDSICTLDGVLGTLKSSEKRVADHVQDISLKLADLRLQQAVVPRLYFSEISLLRADASLERR
jgi:hypothetical protein